VPFDKEFPNADKSKFVSQAEVVAKGNVSAEIFLKKGPGNLQSVFGSDRKYWGDDMKKALGLGDFGGFPYQLSPLITKVSLPIPAEPFEGKAPSLKKIFNAEMKIYVTPDQYFTAKFSEIFQKTKLRHTSAAESKHWLAGSDMKYWPQQLNFAVFCATQGCGVSREIFDSGVDLPPQIRAFYIFHVYFTVRRILYQLGGIQSVSALPDDSTFNQFNNHYDVASYKRLCSEFGIDPTSDFRFTRGANHGLGSIYIWVTAHGPMKTGVSYPGFDKFRDEGGTASKGNLISYIEQDDAAYAQADWFAPNKANGLTKAGLSRINQSIEAYVYCILGAQVNIRSSILGEGGRAKEAQTEFLVLMEDVIRQPDLAKSVQRYQLAVDEAMVRLNLAVAPNAWLMPARMVINTESTIGYNNKLKQAVSGMKLGVNNSVNSVGITPMEGKTTKRKAPPQPSKPVEPKAPLGGGKEQQPTEPKVSETEPKVSDKSSPETAHENNKILLISGFVLAAFVLSHAFSS